MKLVRAAVGLAVALSGIVIAQQVVMATETEDQVVAVAEQWLALADKGDSATTWEMAAGYFQRTVSKEQWSQAFSAARGPLGALRSRQLQSKQRTTTLPGVPDGDYLILQFATSFEKKQSAIETVTPMREPDGTWKVAGYYIK